MMRRAQESVANHLVTRLLERELTAREQAPGRLEMRIGSRLQGLARLGNGLVERRHELRARVQWSRSLARPSLGRDIQLVLCDRHTNPRWNVRDQIRQIAELHGSLVRLPVALARRYLFEYSPRLGGLAFELCQKPFSHRHRSPLASL